MSTAEKKRMLRRKVERFLAARRLPSGAALLLGFSGGPDSTCLVSLLNDIAADRGWRLACAHLDHGLRPEAERQAERERVASFCAALGIPLHERALPAGELERRARETGVGLEEAARRARSVFFQDLRAAHSFDRLLLGHTLDDQLETLLMRLFQGSGPGGLRGIRPASGWILRPLIHATRAEIIEYLQKRRIPFVEDSTNAEDRFLRNRVRHSLVPALTSIFPGMGRSLGALSRKHSLIDDYLARRSHGVVWERTPTGVKTDAALFFRRDPALRLYALYRAVGEMKGGGDDPGPGKRALPFRFIAPLLEKRRADASPVRRKGHGLRLSVSGGSLFLERDIVAQGKKRYVIPINPGIPFLLLERQLVLRLPEARASRPESEICAFRAQKVTLPITIRSRRPGDRIELGFGQKKLKKLLQEMKVEKSERDLVPVIEDGKGILAVLGALTGGKNVARAGAAAPTGSAGRGNNRRETIRLCAVEDRDGGPTERIRETSKGMENRFEHEQ